MASRRHCPPSPCVRFPTRAIQSARRSSNAAQTSLIAPASACASKSLAQPCWPRWSQPTSLMVIMSFAFCRCDNIDVTQVLLLSVRRELPSEYIELFYILHVLPRMFLPRLLAGQHPAARPQDSYSLNSCRYRTILCWKNDSRRRTQLHCFTACRWLLLRALTAE